MGRGLPLGTAAEQARAFGPATSQRASCCGPGPGSAARPEVKDPASAGAEQAGPNRPSQAQAAPHKAGSLDRAGLPA